MLDALLGTREAGTSELVAVTPADAAAGAVAPPVAAVDEVAPPLAELLFDLFFFDFFLAMEENRNRSVADALGVS
ncbi:MAG TPA: hypothetical protein VFD39_05775 [Trueperaceae bacterium]|nr:hypothetical protein [Trueperaceae bacterium]